MTSRFPDIEIYIKQASVDAIEAWLAGHFIISNHHTKGNTTIYALNADIECVVVQQAATGGFTSVWFKSDATPWANDRACALDAFAHLALEVRCSDASWQESAADTTGGWLRIDTFGETPIDWD